MCLGGQILLGVLILTTCRVDQQILQHMIDTQAEFIMEVTDKTKADVKVIYLLLQATSD
jgi:UDP-N-acetylglucosamine pyrophosphorylase